MHILVTRPQTEAPRTTRKLQAMGHHVTMAPLLSIAIDQPMIATSGVQALVLTSRNAVHALAAHPQKTPLKQLPVLAVGKSTAAAARDAGFTVALQGAGGGAELATQIIESIDPHAGTLLHVSGEMVAFDLEPVLKPAGFTVAKAVVYRSEQIDALPAAISVLVRKGALDAVLLMSPRTATAWCNVVAAAGLHQEAKRLVHLCLSSGVADALAPLVPAVVMIAVKPNEEEMLALAARLSSSSADTT
jgi:uroporphyrinogen-III synthase